MAICPTPFKNSSPPETTTQSILICPATDDTPAKGPTSRALIDELANGGHLSYVYLGKGMTQSTNPNSVVMYESARNHASKPDAGINALYLDGHVDWIKQPKADAFIADLIASHNPPPNKK